MSHITTTVRVDPALTAAFGLPGCADQSVLAQTLEAATEADVTALREALADVFERYGQARQHNCKQNLCFASIQFRHRQITLPLSEREQLSLKMGLRQHSLPKVQFATKTLPKDFSA